MADEKLSPELAEKIGVLVDTVTRLVKIELSDDQSAQLTVFITAYAMMATTLGMDTETMKRCMCDVLDKVGEQFGTTKPKKVILN
jgi:hypothetical protein